MTDDELCERANLLVLIADLLEQGAIAEKCDVTVVRDWRKGGDGITLQFEDGTAYRVAITPVAQPDRMNVRGATPGASHVMADEYEPADQPAAPDPNTYTRPDLVEAVKAHAQERYEKRGGWDIIIECLSDGEIEDLIKGCTTKKAAIAKVKAHADLLDDRRRDIQGA